MRVDAEIAELLFAIEGALPFVRSHVGKRLCSSNGGPAALEAILKKYNWDSARWQWIPHNK